MSDYLHSQLLDVAHNFVSCPEAESFLIKNKVDLCVQYNWGDAGNLNERIHQCVLNLDGSNVSHTFLAEGDPSTFPYGNGQVIYYVHPIRTVFFNLELDSTVNELTAHLASVILSYVGEAYQVAQKLIEDLSKGQLSLPEYEEKNIQFEYDGLKLSDKLQTSCGESWRGNSTEFEQSNEYTSPGRLLVARITSGRQSSIDQNWAVGGQKAYCEGKSPTTLGCNIKLEDLSEPSTQRDRIDRIKNWIRSYEQRKAGYSESFKQDVDENLVHAFFSTQK